MRRPIHTILLFSGILIAALVTALSCGVWVATGATPDGKRLERIQASPQYDTEEEIFVNLLEQRLPRFGQISGEYWRNEARTEPEQKVPRVDGLSQRLQTPPPDDLRVICDFLPEHLRWRGTADHASAPPHFPLPAEPPFAIAWRECT